MPVQIKLWNIIVCTSYIYMHTYRHKNSYVLSKLFQPQVRVAMISNRGKLEWQFELFVVYFSTKLELTELHQPALCYFYVSEIFSNKSLKSIKIHEFNIDIWNPDKDAASILNWIVVV